MRGGLAALALGAILLACTQAAPANQGAIAPGNATAIAQGANGAIAPTFDGAKAWAHLQAQVALGPRPAGSPAVAQTRTYITNQLKALGIATKEQPFTSDTPAGRINMVNLIATIAGRRPERLVLATHYDTKRAPFRFVGASDAASSTAVVLELARLLKAQPQEFTIELLFLDGEEAVNWDWRDPDNTYGSRYYVRAAQQAGTLASLKALILLDMVGDRSLNIRRESYSTPWLVDTLWASAGKLGYRSSFPEELTTVEDDHIAFVRAGVPSVDIIDLDYAQWHTAQDDLEHVSQKSLQVVGDVMVDALPLIQQQLAAGRR